MSSYNNKQQKLTSFVTQTDYYSTSFMIGCHYRAYKCSLQMFNIRDQNTSFAYKGIEIDLET